MKTPMCDEDRSRCEEFLSEEDLELSQMSRDEVMEIDNAWLIQAQSTNDADEDEYSRGVFVSPKRAQQVCDEADRRAADQRCKYLQQAFVA